MGNRDDIRIVLGSLRYKTATNTNLSIPTPLVQTAKTLQEFDRSIDINLAQLFHDEREKSTVFRPVCKFDLIFDNAYSGTCNYPPLENNLYYTNALSNAIQQCDTTADKTYWEGYPQYNEFDFIRSDYNISGYTTPDSNGMVHVNFVSKSASTYNWNHFVSYPYLNLPGKRLLHYDTNTVSSPVYNKFLASEGIPFIISIDDSTATSTVPGNDLTVNGYRVIRFRCPVKHGLSVGEFVKIKVKSNNNYEDTFQVYSLGNGLPGYDEYVFNIFNIGYAPGTFSDDDYGNFKRIINNGNPDDTISEYYVVKHKIITNVNDAVLVNAGFEQNVFGDKRQFESSGYTPNRVSRVSYKEGAKSYSLSFNKDIDVSNLRDNHKRPISELYVTTMWKGYFGLMLNNGDKIKEGFDFNLPLSNDRVNPIWKDTISDVTGFTIDNYIRPDYLNPNPPANPPGTIQFNYVRSFKSGDTIDGDFYEWNNFEQKERLISEIYHKLTYNDLVFKVPETIYNKKANGRFGFYYRPHRKMTLRVFSDYIETGDVRNTVDIPDYSYFSTTYNSFIWRDIYEYGFKDAENNGVNYPFLNGTHYPYDNFIFRIIPEGTTYKESDRHYYATLYGAAEPKNDECE
jgi:hypothetical protein